MEWQSTSSGFFPGIPTVTMLDWRLPISNIFNPIPVSWFVRTWRSACSVAIFSPCPGRSQRPPCPPPAHRQFPIPQTVWPSCAPHRCQGLDHSAPACPQTRASTCFLYIARRRGTPPPCGRKKFPHRGGEVTQPMPTSTRICPQTGTHPPGKTGLSCTFFTFSTGCTSPVFVGTHG